jgi:AcrR family transcriptional regulator
MPKETFFNLAKDKQNRILDISLDEFYTHGYEKASISRMVEKAGIAKGSFYQYFEGKEDLFRLIVDAARKKQLALLNQLRQEKEDLPFFELLELLFKGSLVFMKENPQLSMVIDRFMRSADTALKETIMGENVKISNRFNEQILREAAAKKEIRPVLNVAFTAHMMTGLSQSMVDYLRSQITDLSRLDEKEYDRLVAEVLYFLKNGMNGPV